MTAKTCQHCKHFQPIIGNDVATMNADDVGICEWMPREPLPLSWRYTLRERTGMDAGSTNCPAWTERPSANAPAQD